MGIVQKQAINNTLVTYLGFGLGAINILFLYTRFLSDEYFGLIQVVLSASAVLMPILSFGVQNTLVKFYSGFITKDSSRNFLSIMLFLPFIFIIPLVGVTYIANDSIANFLSKKNELVNAYVWHIFIIGLAMAYFEIFFAWGKIHMKSVFGNFMKEIFCRLGVSLLLPLVYFKYISPEQFINALVALYVLRMIIMKIYAFSLQMPSLNIKAPKNFKSILIYSTLIILGGSTAIVLLEVDKIMLNQFIKIENVAYYSVAGFMAAAIAVPSRAMHQITYPLTAKLLNTKDYQELELLYKKSSLTLFIIASALFLLLILNLDDIFYFFPENYNKGYYIVIWLGLVKVYDSVLGNNNSILFNSDYYKAILFLGVLLAFLTILFNLWLIPEYGLKGAAIASFMAFFIYNTIKLVYVKRKLKISPFTIETFKVSLIIIGLGILFYYLPFNMHPILNILVKSLFLICCYISILYKLKISNDFIGLINKLLEKINLL